MEEDTMKKRMKKIVGAILAATMTMSMVACGDSSGSANTINGKTTA